MAFINRAIMAVSLLALGACASAPPQTATPAGSAQPDVYAGRSVLDAAIEAAGGEAALRKVKELGWTGGATLNADGQTTVIEMETIVRPFTWARTTSWPKAEGEKAARTIQAEQGKAWQITKVVWTPMPVAQAEHENQQYSLYGVMMLVGLKDAGVAVQETAPGKDGSRNLHVEHPKAPPIDLRFDSAGRLIRAAFSVSDPKGAAAPLAQVVEFSGEMISNGVKWPKQITIRQGDAPYFDLTLSKFEARPEKTVAPVKHMLDDGGRSSGAEAG
jgi:hypothetical protein